MGMPRGRLDLSHFHDMAKGNHRGLVPMEFIEAAMPHAVGDVAGYKPADAKQLHDRGIAVPHGSVYERGSVAERRDASRVVPETDDELRRSQVDLGDDPLERHHLQRIKLAAQIAGRDVSKADEADEIIRAEIARRGEVQQRAGGAVTSDALRLPAA
ncbi:hypothetical protein LOK46_13525 [Methylobacterium sp. NMS14P]|uniref:hypothetical protein n=1 Tax=Methylobacterium sp. NMS14P TaxID=2894310 RepID=UPI00235A3640|nr:hypothetical protein [Methylobacterium sp. NMS14P]WCS27795.1 hypothetical protein LOK46_13525 [Methylobacterium sp. NMS14P]